MAVVHSYHLIFYYYTKQEENSIERKLYNYGQAEWEDEEYEP